MGLADVNSDCLCAGGAGCNLRTDVLLNRLGVNFGNWAGGRLLTVLLDDGGLLYYKRSKD